MEITESNAVICYAHDQLPDDHYRQFWFQPIYLKCFKWY